MACTRDPKDRASEEVEDDQLESTPVVDESVEEEEEPEAAVNNWYCAACSQDFKSQGACDNHERSKKHCQKAQRLRKQMLEGDAKLSLSTPVSSTLPSNSETRSPTPEEAVLNQKGAVVEEGLDNISLQQK
ncbi:hypothetical protein MJO28_001762 [Puccinia striiformis f. sp. tritici]|uniref:C2H2-type domain-containing protein n=3 Tax=Puccinia striiformis TaxID=27350 RepID=A0A0L0W4H4_9BASI|nr:hypothetical protein MJO28_001762 [Puccinia striiformis f. sp. tritici]KAI7966057.1 hypothetical protein MJO29_001805 [Puccinia striiformis f. sp. tritici]KNF06406.1 hypothetical protein PSTG_00289 [Puccinia striiformis f. sp. tritici PST-78]POV96443.1 hypothetical protein PSTT_15655 [Puccinia striiformis]